jgi:hypothetical protein
MGVAQQNFTFEQGQSFNAQLTFQIPGLALPTTGTTGFNSNQVTSVGANLSSMAVGMSVSGTGIQANTIVTNISGTTLTLSLPATAAGTGVALTVGAQVAVNLTGATFLFTAKTSKTLADSDPTAVKVNWSETSTPLLGQTNLVITDTTTAGMLVSPTFYYYQIWGSGLTGYPPLFPIQEGLITVTQSVSTRTS